MKTKKLFILIFILLLQVSLPSFSEILSTLNLMPFPQKVSISDARFILDKNLKIKITGPFSDRILNAKKYFLKRLSDRTGIFFKTNDKNINKILLLEYKNTSSLDVNMDESYNINIKSSKIKISANSDIGILRGLETLLQLLSVNKYYYFPGIKINDFPRFPWRGLLIDVSRHFMPVEVIKRNIKGMATVKMNIIHLHLSDDQGFRVECKSFPKLHKIASDGFYYSHEQIKDLIDYADKRGIRVVPEFDIPGHTTSWLVAYPELAAINNKEYKMERSYGVKKPVMDPSSDKVYKFLDIFLKEMGELFPDDYFHIGGDEVEGSHWENSKKILSFMESKNIKNNHELQAYFNKRILKILEKYNKKMIGWDEIFQPNLPKNIVIQSWRGKQTLFKTAKLGYKSILSNGYYIDLCKSTSYHYLNDPISKKSDIKKSHTKNILGGEATMWAELVNYETVDSRIWPRTAAIAERFWSSPSINDISNMYKRLKKIKIQLEEAGLTHIKNQDMLLRRLCQGSEIKPLKIFIQTVEPVKNYKRHSNKKYTIFHPLTRVVDASIPDPDLPREFGYYIKGYLKSKNNLLKKKIIFYLYKWKNNHNDLIKLIDNYPILEEIRPVAQNLYKLSTMSIQILETDKKNKLKNLKEKLYSLIKKSKKPHAELELKIIEPLRDLLLSN